jgi:hypothetical protein
MGCSIPGALTPAAEIPYARFYEDELPARIKGFTGGMLGLVDALLVLAEFGQRVTVHGGIEPVDVFLVCSHPNSLSYPGSLVKSHRCPWLFRLDWLGLRRSGEPSSFSQTGAEQKRSAPLSISATASASRPAPIYDGIAKGTGWLQEIPAYKVESCCETMRTIDRVGA